MLNKEKIINLFYNEHLKPVDIALELNVSNSYVSKVIKKNFRYHEEKIKGNNKTNKSIKNKPLNT